MVDVLRSKPELYARLKEKKTELGISFARCIKDGIDNLGHEQLENCRIVAGDEESYQLFRDLFEPIISLRHDGYVINKTLQSGMSIEKLIQAPIDPSGRYVITCRIRCVRSIKGFRLPAAITFKERRSIEKMVVQALMEHNDGCLAGDYYPLNGSRSYLSKPDGMTLEQERVLRSSGVFFQNPDNTMTLSAGIWRHWPDARGIFINREANTFVWINEEDHVRVIAMEKGQNIQAVFSRCVYRIKALEEELKKTSNEFMFKNCLGFISSCPSSIRTGIRIGCHMKIPYLSSRSDFKSLITHFI